MQFSILLSALTLAAGAAATAVVDNVLGIRQGGQLDLLTLSGVPGVGSFHGVGAPGRCQELPRNVADFNGGRALDGFSCSVFTESNCQGSFVQFPEERNRLGKPPGRTQYRSWKCSCNCK